MFLSLFLPFPSLQPQKVVNSGKGPHLTSASLPPELLITFWKTQKNWFAKFFGECARHTDELLRCPLTCGQVRVPWVRCACLLLSTQLSFQPSLLLGANCTGRNSVRLQFLAEFYFLLPPLPFFFFFFYHRCYFLLVQPESKSDRHRNANHFLTQKS